VYGDVPVQLPGAARQKEVSTRYLFLIADKPAGPGPAAFASNGLDLIHQGAVAQLGERLICIQEAVGSIPISSTSV
jgi:hypothetical protein